MLLKRSSEGGEQYAFPHRTFQEFLAGDYIRRNKDYRRLALERAAQVHWHEALTLMVGYQAKTGANLAMELNLIRELLTCTPIEQALAGELLVEIGREGVAEYDAKEIKRDGLWGLACRQLLTMADAGRAPAAPATLRVRAGLALGQLSGGPVAELARGAIPPLGDPRLPLAYLRWPKITQTDGWRKMWARYWCAIEPGQFWHGDDREKAPLRQVELPRKYRIARFPATNADYAQFVAAGGYTERRWWTAEGWKFLQPGGHPFITLPRYWDDPAFNNPLQPVVGVSWYEAAAYCNWLTAQGHAQGWLPEGDAIRLPTWLEWERAARHTDQRRYPWGDQLPTSEHANYRDTEIGRPSPIGCFPAGAAKCGAQDMVGNISEWLATLYKQADEVEHRKDFTASDTPLFTYSAFSDTVENLCCGARGGNVPYYGGNILGFRVVLSRALIV